MADFVSGYYSAGGLFAGAVPFTQNIVTAMDAYGNYFGRFTSDRYIDGNIFKNAGPDMMFNKNDLPANWNAIYSIPLFDDSGTIGYYAVMLYHKYIDGLECWAVISTDPQGNNIVHGDNSIFARAGGNDYCGFTLCSFETGGNTYIGVVCCDSQSPTGYTTSLWAQGQFHNITGIMNGLYVKPRTVEQSETFGPASQAGGYSGGTFDDSSDVIAIPNIPAIGVSSVGFVNVYHISTNGLQSFGSELFPDLNFTPIGSLPAPSDVTEALVNVATVLTDFGNQIPNIIDMYINNTLINYIIDCHIIPVSPADGAVQPVKVGFKSFTQSAAKVASDYIDFNCGDLNIGEYYSNFADYEPYTKAKLFLPFVGFVDLKPEFWQGGIINITYRFNVIDGSFICFVRSTSSKSNLTDTVVAQYGGNCCVHIPITGANYSNLVSGIVAGAGAVASAQPGSRGDKLVTTAIDIANTKANVQQSNSYNATTSFLGVRIPYLLIERTVSNMSSAYPDEIGIPSNINSDFSQLSGYVKSEDVILNGITGATDAELNEISRLLAGGVIL